MLKSKFDKILLLILAIASSWSLLKPGLFPLHDTVHSARISQMWIALSAGHFPTRWLDGFGQGYGSPVFNYYAPLPYYVGAFLYGLSNNFELTFKILFVICNLITIWSSLKLARTFKFGFWPSWLMVSAIVLAPYRAVDLFVRGALSEAWAISFLPLVLANSIAILKGEKNKTWLFATSLALLALSHNLTALMSIVWLMIIWLGLIFNLTPKQRLSRIKVLWLGIGLGLLLSAFYWLPMLVELKYVGVVEGSINSFPYYQYFVYARQLVTPLWGFGGAAPGPYNDQSSFLGYGQLLGLLLALFMFARIIIRQQRKKAALWSGVVATLFLSLLMTHGRSEPIWQAVPQLQIIQFPWRWLSLALVTIGLLVGLVAEELTKHRASFLLLPTILLVIVFGNVGFFRPEKILSSDASNYYLDFDQIKNQTSPGYLDYLPRSAKLVEQPANQTVSVTASQAAITQLAIKPHRKVVKVNSRDSGQIIWHTYNFPGWTLFVDGKKADTFQLESGEIAANLLVGEHIYTLEFEETPIRKLANYLSLLGILLLFRIRKLGL